MPDRVDVGLLQVEIGAAGGAPVVRGERDRRPVRGVRGSDDREAADVEFPEVRAVGIDQVDVRRLRWVATIPLPGERDRRAYLATRPLP